MHVAQDLAEGNIVLQIEHVAERLHLAGMVVKHQQHPGVGQHNEQIERDSAHAPGVAVAHGVAVDFCRMQMQEHIREYPQRAVARRVIVLVAEDGGVDLGLGWILQPLDLFFRLGRNVGLKALDVLFHPSLHLFQ